jgi:hypothetical protein
MIVFGRVMEAPGRWPTPRAHADLTQNAEIGLTRSQHILEQRMQERDLRCASAPRCLFRIDMELPSLLFVLGNRSAGLAKTLSRSLQCIDAITALDAHSVHQLTDEAIWP